MIFKSVTDVCAQSSFLQLGGVLPDDPVFVKLEGLNLAGSIKLKTARALLADLEGRGILRPGSEIIESSSGNMGIALAMASAAAGYQFTCVSDPNILPATARVIEALGARLITVTVSAEVGGYVQTRVNLIAQMIDENPRLVWPNQYANPANSAAHYQTTGPEILAQFPKVDWVFIGTGTTGTAMGCARFLREHSPHTKVIGVDPVGSVTFGGTAAPRFLPGIGSSKRPALADESLLHGVLRVGERETIAMCQDLARRHGLLLGASSGTVLAAIKMNAAAIRVGSTVVAIAADFGERYLDTLYNPQWIHNTYGPVSPT
ncbi:MAG: 2,3-diaminopropionate biosynthesis protein SbnA [Pseudomonadota bacterium]